MKFKGACWSGFGNYRGAAAGTIARVAFGVAFATPVGMAIGFAIGAGLTLAMSGRSSAGGRGTGYASRLNRAR